MKSIRTAQQELNTLKNGVIGLFKSRNSNVFELVVNHQETNQTIDVIRVTQFAVIQLEFDLPIHYGTLKLFPEKEDGAYKSMNDMLDDPFGFDAFIKSFS